MRTISITSKGRNVDFTTRSVTIDGVEYLYSNISELRHSEEKRVYGFKCGDEVCMLPYEEKDAKVLKAIFSQVQQMHGKKAAAPTPAQKPSGADVQSAAPESQPAIPIAPAAEGTVPDQPQVIAPAETDAQGAATGVATPDAKAEEPQLTPAERRKAERQARKDEKRRLKEQRIAEKEEARRKKQEAKEEAARLKKEAKEEAARLKKEASKPADATQTPQAPETAEAAEAPAAPAIEEAAKAPAAEEVAKAAQAAETAEAPVTPPTAETAEVSQGSEVAEALGAATDQDVTAAAQSGEIQAELAEDVETEEVLSYAEIKDNTAPHQRGKRFKKSIIIFIIILAVLALAAVAWYFFIGPAADPQIGINSPDDSTQYNDINDMINDLEQ